AIIPILLTRRRLTRRCATGCARLCIYCSLHRTSASKDNFMEKKPFPLLKTRRDFIRQAACAAVGTAALSSTIRDLRLINAAMAGTCVDDYKALVCIFLS